MLDERPWHWGVQNQDPHAFLTWPPSELPRFEEYEWHIHAAIAVIHEFTLQHSTRNDQHKKLTAQPSTPQALLVLKKKPTTFDKYGNLELPTSKIAATDIDVEDSLRRIINSTTGLHFDQILTTLSRIQMFEPRMGGPGSIHLRFVVSVTEALPHDAYMHTPITLSAQHESHRWICKNDHVDKYSPMKPSHQKLVTTAFDTGCFEWHTTMEYLSMEPSALPFTNHFEYIICAAIIRLDADTNTPQILLIKRGDYKKGAGNWELPGGKIDADACTVREALRSKILHETGMRVTSVLGSTRRKPIVLPPRRKFVESKGMVNLAYLVKVEAAQVVKLQEEYSDYTWIGSLEEARKLKMTFAGLKAVREALAAVAEGFRAGREVVEA